MTSKEGNELIVDDAQQPEDMDEDSGGSSSNVRVKGVEEINSTVNLSASPSEESGKRKLPVWMQSNSESKDVKRTKTGSGQELKNRTENDPDSAVPSSSSIDGASGNDLQHPQGQREDENAVQNNEINASNEAASTNEPEDDKNEVIIKEEPEEACSSNTGEADGGDNTEEVEVDESKVKTENEDSSEPASSSAVDSKADIKVVKVEATSSTRDSCKFGVRCYRVAGSSKINKPVEPLFQSDSESKSNDEEQKKKVLLKKKRQLFSWIFVKKFDNVIQAQEALSEENTWSAHYSNDSEEGKKIYYRCNKVKKHGPQCSAKRYVLYDSTSDAVFIYQTDADHDHEDKVSSKYGIPKAVKLEINKLFALHLKPKAIMTALQKIEGIQVPKITQLRNYLSDRRRALYGNHTISLGELQQWLQDNSVLPEHPHKTFVIAYDISKDDASFRFVLSSKYLLELGSDVDILNVDATHKLIWQGYPVMIVGTTDKQHKFHPLCLAVSTTEQKEDLQLVFKSMKDKIQSLFSNSFKPTILVCDGTKSIQNAFTEEFKDTIVRICWAHAKRKIQSRIESDVKKSIQKQILEDVDTLHSITNQDAFTTASNLFLQKYDEEREFIDYFKEQWLVQNQNWYLGATPVSPSTNNALEAFTKVIKDSNTLRERLQLSRFLVLAKEMVNKWSTKYIKNPEENFIAKSPLISLKEWANSYNWAKLPNKIVVTPRDDENFIYYEIPATEAKECEVFENPPENFDEFKEQFFSKWEVALPINKEEWVQGKCTCPTFFKMYMCKHLIGLSIRLKYTVPPLEVKNITFDQKRKRGRPCKAKPALIIP